jgi:hypothetical protein
LLHADLQFAAFPNVGQTLPNLSRFP